MADDRPFFARVESLRGLGAVAVAAYHFSGWTVHGVSLFPATAWDGAGTLQNAMGRLGLALMPGHAALMIFFVVSGFVLRVSLGYGPQNVSAAAAKFFLSRIFRIYPVVIFALLLTVVLAKCQILAPGPVFATLTMRQFVANLLLLDTSINGALWALQVELLMAPLIVSLYFLERCCGPRAILGLALVATGLAFKSGWAIWPPLSANLFAFVLGMVVPTIGRRVALDLSKRAATFLALGAVMALLLCGPCLGFFSRASAVVEAYAAVVLVSLVAYRFDVAMLNCLDARVLRRLGLASGSYYVLHMATAPAAIAVASALIPPLWSANVPAAVGFLVTATWLVGIVPLMVCSFYLIEAPGIGLGRRIMRYCRLDSHLAASPGSQQVATRLAA